MSSSIYSISNFDALREIGAHAFDGAYNFTTTDFIENLEVIEDYGFSNAKLGSKITLGENLRGIGQYGFYNVKAITEIVFKGYSGSQIGRFAFKGLSNLKTVICSTDSAPKLESVYNKVNVDSSKWYEDFGWYQFADAGTSAYDKKLLVSVGTSQSYLKISGDTATSSTYVRGDEVSWVYLTDTAVPYAAPSYGFEILEEIPLTGVCDVKIYVGGVEYEGNVYATLGHLDGVYVQNNIGGSYMIDIEGMYDNEVVSLYSDNELTNLIGTFRPRISKNEYQIGEPIMSASPRMRGTDATSNENEEMAEITKSEYEALVSRLDQMTKIIKRLVK